MRLYRIIRKYFCSLDCQECESITKPKCKTCETYLRYKISGLTIKEFSKYRKGNY